MLTSRGLRRPACQLLSLPIRIVRPRHRAFHASAPRHGALDTLLFLPHEMLNLLHMGLPWWSAIPASAFIMRGLLVTTIGSRTRDITSRYLALQPLRQAIADQVFHETMQKGGFKNQKAAQHTVVQTVKVETKELDKRWDCRLSAQVGWTFVQLPIFLTMAEVIRRMCGTRSGLIGLFMNATGLGSSSENDVLVGGATASAPAVLSNPWFDVSLANEGMLWFPDLLVPDPTGILPFIVSGLMFSNIYFTNNSPEKLQKMTRLSKTIRRTLLLVSLAIGPLTQNVPAALMFYWASSTTSVMIWNKWLDKRYPTPEGFTKCKRPLLMPPKTRRASVK
ncbi:hypothetical protein CC78DRAFT_531487 [Lojkania enalia]|uniref:Uncharacterized protein n=1 Tax=Lojkania enalia TaxID=147567 RepID=A0A9P4KEJ1_9PLEO|nr:hypothetical protein CC78DRAFT_531487 [Didymosphaeria enalia]